MRPMRLPASPSRSVFTIGMPPATAASKLSATPFSSASSASATPCLREQRLVGGDDALARRRARLRPRSSPDRLRRRSVRRRHRCRDRRASAIGLSTLRIFDRSSVAHLALGTGPSTAWRPLDRPAGALDERRARRREHSGHGRGTDRAQTGNVPLSGVSTIGSQSGGRSAVQPPLGERERRCATFPARFQETGGYCGRPGGCAARSRPARCAHNPRRIRRSRCPARPRLRPSPPAAWRTRRAERSNGSGIGAQANIEARGGGTCQPARPKLSTSTSRRRL